MPALESGGGLLARGALVEHFTRLTWPLQGAAKVTSGAKALLALKHPL